MLLGGKIFFRYFDLLLIAAQVEIGRADLGNERDHHVAAVLLGGLEIGGGRFKASARAAENIKLPGGVEAGLIKIMTCPLAPCCAPDVPAAPAASCRWP